MSALARAHHWQQGIMKLGRESFSTFSSICAIPIPAQSSYPTFPPNHIPAQTKGHLENRVTMVADSHDNYDLERQPKPSPTAGNKDSTNPLRSVFLSRSPLVDQKTHLRHEFTSTLGSSRCRSLLSSVLPSPNSSETVFEMSMGNGSVARQKSTGSSRPSFHQSRANTHQSHGTTTQQSHEGKEHRYKGYSAFSSLLSSDKDAFVVRKFGSLHVRTILLLQDEITQLEDRLAQIDEEVAVDQQDDYLCHNGSFRGDKMWHHERYDIVNHLATLLEKYGQFTM